MSMYLSRPFGEKKCTDITSNITNRNSQKELKNKKPASRLLLKDIGVPKGAILTYVNDPTVKCTVVDTTNNIVEYKGKEYTLSGMIRTLKGNKYTYQGSLYLMYNGKRLTEIRKEMGI